MFEIGPAWKAIYNRKFLQERNIKFKSEREILSEDYIFSAEVCAKAKCYFAFMIKQFIIIAIMNNHLLILQK